MLPISMFWSSLRALPGTIPRALPRNIPRPHAFPPLRILSSFPRYASGRPPRPPRIIRGRLIPFDPEEAARAKPLINAAEWGRKASSKQAKWIYIFCIGSGVVFYVTHLETVPVSGRRRFMFFGDEAVESDGRKLYQAILNDAHDSLLPAWDPRVRQVQRVMKRLIPACGMENVDWEVHVIQSNEANAFVIPGGKVFVFTGILPIAQDDDGLAAILGHEIAHNLARHAAEAMSSNLWLILPLRFVFPVIEVLITGQMSGFSRVVGDFLLDVGLAKPASRKQESEADYIGLMIMAKSCYNPAAATSVWERMEAAQAGGHDIPQFMSTHPANKTRIAAMQAWLPKAEEARTESECGDMLQYSKDFSAAMQQFDPWAMFK